jgi:hypothetical protein
MLTGEDREEEIVEDPQQEVEVDDDLVVPEAPAQN